MSTHKRISTHLLARAEREIAVTVAVVCIVAASLAADARHVYGWARYCSAL